MRIGRTRGAGLVAAAALAAGCVTIPPGHAAVITPPWGGTDPKPAPEGVAWVGPLGQVDVLDLRSQERNEDLRGVAADGATVEANASVVTYHLIPDELVAFDEELGPEPYDRIIKPIVQAAVRQVVARYTAVEIIDTTNVPAIQAAVTELAGRQLRPMHVQLDMVFMRSLTVRSGPFYEEVLATGREEQLALTAPQLLAIARQRADVLREDGRSLSASHAILAPTLTTPQLEDQATRAWSALLLSPNTAVVVEPPIPMTLEVAP